MTHVRYRFLSRSMYEFPLTPDEDDDDVLSLRHASPEVRKAAALALVEGRSLTSHACGTSTSAARHAPWETPTPRPPRAAPKRATDHPRAKLRREAMARSIAAAQAPWPTVP